ncbi:velvet factor [Gorgonomyces haynaldii]|nr:velvet factor [Gorgonomyces haynaldii]
MNKTYEIVVRQQAKKGRMTGFSQDLRSLCPSLILQVLVKENGRIITQVSEEECLSLVCTLRLVEVNSTSRAVIDSRDEDRNATLREENNLLGNSAACCQQFVDLHGNPGMFFLFPDLGIRSPGKYRFQCSVFRIDLELDAMPVLVTEFTQPCSIVSPKNYPRPQGPTRLAKSFVEQGADLRLR